MRAAIVPLLGAVLLAGCGPGGSNELTATTSTPTTCDESRTLTCTFFDVASGTWTDHPPQTLSIASACTPAGANGEIDAYVTGSGTYLLDRVGFTATGSAVRPGMLKADDAAGGTAYACGQPGARVLTQLFCGKDVGMGELTLRFSFAGRWSDGTEWTKDCDATVSVTP